MCKKILNYKLFNSKLGDEQHCIPVVLGKTITSKWVGDTSEQINILEYWKILWFNGISHYKNGIRTEIVQKSYFYYIFKWILDRITKLIDNIINIIGSGIIAAAIIKLIS